MKKQENMQNANSINTDHTDHFTLQNDLWTELICAFEFVGAGLYFTWKVLQGIRCSKEELLFGSNWLDCVAVADVTWRPLIGNGRWGPSGGATWLLGTRPLELNSFIHSWLSSAQWLYPAVSIALRDESRLISERMKHLFYEVPVRVAGGLLFELLGQSVGDPLVEEDDVPVVLRSWQAQNFLVTALHIKGSASKLNVIGITEVQLIIVQIWQCSFQELLAAGGTNIPHTIHEVIAHLASRLARWDYRRNHEDLHLFSIILNQEIRRLSTQVIRVKWSLHAREEIVFELLHHLRGSATRCLLEGIMKSSRAMIEEQEAVRGRLFTIQDVMQSTVRAWLQTNGTTEGSIGTEAALTC
ncbi:hypothetical protein L484_021383 [Morus notabilis]|uniref:Uncharacterized protein n=1 Tax=Morus notabilis TaxID=981085 RepID=W9RHT7_9ROSA|nr:hypothetical protein L484_021383 [Morus notabilis]